MHLWDLEAIPDLETKSLLLKEIREENADAYFEFYSDDEVMRTWGTTPHKSIDDTRGLIAFHRTGFHNRTSIRWGVFHKDTGKLIGDVGYWRFVKERWRAEVGTKLAKAYWNGGLITEALGEVTRFGLQDLGLHSVEANIDPENIGAIKLVEKLGYEREGLLKEHSYCSWREKFIDTALYSVLTGNAMYAKP